MTSAPRYFFAAMPPANVAGQLFARLVDTGVAARLGERMFPLEHLHQSLSGRHFEPDAAAVERLLQAGGRIVGNAVTLTFNRIAWSRNDDAGRNYCTLLANGRPPAFDALLGSVQRGLDTVGLADREGHRPHMTLSYNAGSMQSAVRLLPLHWTIDEVLLLKGHGSPYGYDVVGRWPLLPEGSLQRQDGLFAFG